MSGVSGALFLAMFILSTLIICYIAYTGRVERVTVVLLLPITTCALFVLLFLSRLEGNLGFGIGLGLLVSFFAMILAFLYTIIRPSD